jgi:hypothetical protein
LASCAGPPATFAGHDHRNAFGSFATRAARDHAPTRIGCSTPFLAKWEIGEDPAQIVFR